MRGYCRRRCWGGKPVYSFQQKSLIIFCCLDDGVRLKTMTDNSVLNFHDCDEGVFLVLLHQVLKHVHNIRSSMFST